MAGGDRHEGYDYTIRNEVIERAHHVEEVISDDPDASLDENETRSYTYYSYFEIRSDGHVTPLSLPDEVDSRRSYMQASQRLLTPEELALMEPENLRLMRNEVFAAYGHIFDSRDLQEHFRAQPWYDPTGDATHRLTDIEKRNIQLIMRAENNIAGLPIQWVAEWRCPPVQLRQGDSRILYAFLALCATAAGAAAQTDSESEVVAVRGAFLDYVEAVNEGDVEAIREHYFRGAVSNFDRRGGRLLAVTSEDSEADLGDLVDFDLMSGQEIRVLDDDLDVFVYGDSAVVTGYWIGRHKSPGEIADFGFSLFIGLGEGQWGVA